MVGRGFSDLGLRGSRLLEFGLFLCFLAVGCTFQGREFSFNQHYRGGALL